MRSSVNTDSVKRRMSGQKRWMRPGRRGFSMVSMPTLTCVRCSRSYGTYATHSSNAGCGAPLRLKLSVWYGYCVRTG